MPRIRSKDFAGNNLQGNQANGSSIFTIIGNAPPNLTNVNTLPGSKNNPLTITFAQLQAASDLQVVTGHTAEFLIEASVNGTLQITDSSGTSAVVFGTTLFGAGDTLTWTPPAGAAGLTGAFTVLGYDVQNASIAPALSESTVPVLVNVNLINFAPTLTTISTFPGTNENTSYQANSYAITYAALLAASNAADVNHDPIQFHIETVTTGTLQINTGSGYNPVVPGTTEFAAGDTLLWTPPEFLNNSINGGPINAFTVLANDGSLDSAPPAVAVPINVAPLPNSPILTTVSTLQQAGVNSPFKITYASLLAASNAQNVDGHPIQFEITSIPAGVTLGIRQAASPNTTVPVVIGSGTAIVNPGDTLIWTAPSNVFGPTVPAFNVVGYDAFNAANFPAFATSSPPVTVNVDVIDTPSPTATTTATVTDPRNAPSIITYANLVSSASATVAAGDTLGFLINWVTSGTLTITHLGSTSAVVPGTTVVLAGDTLTWNSGLPAPGVTGVKAAFNMTALDTTDNVTALDPTQVSVNLVNVAPTLTSIATLSIADQQTPFAISYFTLLGASNVADADNDPLQFQINSISSGTLTITHNNVVSAVVPGSTVFVQGDTLTWTPANGVTGSAINAFAVTAFDPVDSLTSSPPVQVTINVRAFGSAFNLSGPWQIDNGSGTSIGMGRITQNGASLTVVNQNGLGSSAHYTGFATIVASNFDNQSSVAGTVDTSTADDGRILWADGTVWLRIALGGQYSVSGPGIKFADPGIHHAKRRPVEPRSGRNDYLRHDHQHDTVDGCDGGGNIATAIYGDGRISFEYQRPGLDETRPAPRLHESRAAPARTSFRSEWPDWHGQQWIVPDVRR